MFGSLRFLLAYLVILSHLVGSEYVAHFGFYAVRGFFVISGLMMTAALNEVYAFDNADPIDPEQFADIIGRNFREPGDGLGFDDSPVARMWRTMICPNNFL